MAGEIAEFLVRLSTVFDDKGVADAKKAIEEALDPIDAMKHVLGELGLAVSAGAAIWGLVEFGKESLEKFSELEQSSMQLSMAMKNLGVYTEESFKAMQEYAAKQSETTAFSREQVQNTMALLTTFGLYGKKLEEVAQGAMNLAVARHMDLNSAAMLLGRAYDGNTTMLKRYGITIHDTGDSAKNFEQVMHLMQERFGGAAAAQAQTYAGKVAIMTHNFDELKVKIGTELLPVAEAWLDWINKAITPGTQIEKLKARQTLLAADMATMATHGGVLAKETQHYKDLKKELGEVEAALKREQALLKAEPPPPKQPPPRFGGPEKKPVQQEGGLNDMRIEAREASRITNEALDEQLEKYTSTKAQEKEIEGTRLAAELEAAGRHQDALAVIAARKVKVDKLTNAELREGAAQTFGFISSLSNMKNKELAAIGKAAAISQATINTYAAASASYKWGTQWGGPPLGSVMAALAIAAGMAQVANIAGVQLAEGGIVRARPGGVQATIGEGGQDEVVAPLSKLRGMLGSAGAGRGDVHGHVHQTVIFQGAAAGTSSGGYGDMAELMDRMRQATRDGQSEALDLAKQLARTAADRSNEA